MVLRFRCGACGEPLRAPEGLAGKRVKCPGCGGAQTVPPAGALTTAPAPAAAGGDSPPAPPPVPKGKRRPDASPPVRLPALQVRNPWLVCGALGALLAVALPVALFGHLGARSLRKELAEVRESLAAAERQAAEVQAQLAEARGRAPAQPAGPVGAEKAAPAAQAPPPAAPPGDGTGDSAPTYDNVRQNTAKHRGKRVTWTFIPLSSEGTRMLCALDADMRVAMGPGYQKFFVAEFASQPEAGRAVGDFAFSGGTITGTVAGEVEQSLVRRDGRGVAVGRSRVTVPLLQHPVCRAAARPGGGPAGVDSPAPSGPGARPGERPAGPDTAGPPAGREQKLRAALRRCRNFGLTVTSDNLQASDAAWNALKKGQGDLAERFPLAARAVARKVPKGWFHMLVDAGDRSLSLTELHELLGKEDSTAKDSLQITTGPPPQYLAVTWYFYGWCGFGVDAGGKVAGLKADCAALPPEGPAPAGGPMAPPEAKGPPADAEEAARAAEALLNAVTEGRLGDAWEALPATYRKDLNDLAHDFAGRMDPELWRRLMAVLKNTGALLETKSDDLLAALGTAASPEVVQNLPVIAKGLRSLAGSDFADLDRMKIADLGALLRRQDRLRPANIPGPGVKVRVVDRQGDRVRVRVELPKGGPAGALMGGAAEDREVDLVRVEGKWVPKEVADGWAAGMASARKSVAALTAELSGESKRPVLALLVAVDDTLNSLLKARDREAFQAALRTGGDVITRRAQAVDGAKILSRLDAGPFGETARPEGTGVEAEIRRHRARPGAVLVVQASDGKYWSFAVSGIKDVKGRTITLLRGTTVANGGTKGKRTPDEIVGDFVAAIRNPGGGGYFVQLGDGGPTASGIVGQAKDDTTIHVKAVLGAREEK